jgi:hypothetical protein
MYIRNSVRRGNELTVCLHRKVLSVGSFLIHFLLLLHSLLPVQVLVREDLFNVSASVRSYLLVYEK